MFRIEKPGIYLDVPTEDYFKDPCPAPSLTQSVAKVLIERSPLHAWHAHPRLNPDYRHDDDTKFDVGNIAHKLMLGRGKNVVRLEFDDWRTKAAKEAREAAAVDGKLAVLGKHYARAERMVIAAREQLDLRGLNLFRAGDGEVVVAWQETGGVWCRQMIDWLTPDRQVFADFKTTGMSVAPHALARMMVNAGWDVQAAFAERALMAVDPLGDRRRFMFVVQEDASPYCLSVVEMSEAVMTMGRKKIDAALRVWRNCTQHDRWPGYPLDLVVPDYPGWAESQWLDREETEFADGKIPHDLLMAG